MTDPRLDEKMLQWSEEREKGRTLSVEELCVDCPELETELARRVDILEKFDRLITPTGDTQESLSTLGRDETSLSTASQISVKGYEILKELGRGGMGVVYLAIQRGANRQVALKMLRYDHFGAADAVRFQTEVESAASIQHPHIAQVYEVGSVQETPYYSLEYCAGGSLAQRLALAPLHGREAASLLEPLAQAIQAAHDRGIIHRDLKPGNILLAGGGPETPLSQLIPKVADFGLARKLDEVGQTQTGAVLGTPSYMAPEQAEGRTNAHSPAMDIYSLGAILYECLTGRPPFKAATAIETVMMVTREDPVPPRRFVAGIERDIETICLKCLEKEPKRRYTSAQALAEDLRRFQRGEPILARPVSSIERGVKWVRRHPAWAGLIAASVGLVTALLATAFVMVRNAEERFGYQVSLGEAQKKIDVADQKLIDTNREIAARAKELAAIQTQQVEVERGLAETRDRLYASDMVLASRAWAEGRMMHLREILSKHAPTKGTIPRWEYRYLQQLAMGSPRFHGHAGTVYQSAFSPDGNFIATCSPDSSIVTWNIKAAIATADKNGIIWPSGSFATRFTGHTEGLHGVAFSTDGSSLIALSTYCKEGTGWRWDLKTKKKTLVAPGVCGNGTQACIALSPDRKRVARDLQGEGGHSVTLAELDRPQLARQLVGLTSNASRLAFSADGKHIAASSTAGTALVWDTETGELLNMLKHPETTWGIAFSPSGERLFVGSDGGMMHVWDLKTEKLVNSFRAHQGRICFIGFSPDGLKFVTSSTDRQVKLWDASTMRELQTYRGHDAQVHHVAFSSDSTQLLSSSQDATAILWDINKSQGIVDIVEARNLRSAFTKATSRISLVTPAKTILRNLAKKTDDIVTSELPHGEEGFVLSEDGHYLAATTTEAILLFDAAQRREIRKIAVPNMRSAVLNANGHLLAAISKVSEPNAPRVWDTQTGVERKFEPANYTVDLLRFSADDNRLAAKVSYRMLAIWDVALGRIVHTVHIKTMRAIQCYAIDPTGTKVAVGLTDFTLKLLDIDSGQELWSSKTATIPACVAFDPQGSRIVTGGSDGTVTLWNTANGAELLSLKGHQAVEGFPAVLEVAFSADGRFLATQSGHPDYQLKVWDAGPSGK